jgi:hypothetical protein
MIRFKRPPYHKKKPYGVIIPVLWHILDEDNGYTTESRALVGLCGYRWDNIFMDVKISKAVKSKPAGPHCSKCIDKAGSQSVR